MNLPIPEAASFRIAAGVAALAALLAAGPAGRSSVAGPLRLLDASVAADPAAPAGTPGPGREPTIVLAAHADCRGELKPCHCPGDPSGGLARRAALVKTLRARGEPVVLVDAGDFAPAADDSLREPLADLFLEAMALMRYDAVAPGENEVSLGPDYLARAARALPLVSANLSGSAIDPEAIPAVRRIDAGGLTVVVTAILDPLLFYETPGALEIDPAGLLVRDPIEALAAVRAELAEADLAVVLAHASIERLREIADGIDVVDVWVAGHEPELSPRPGRLGEAWVIEPGPRSRQLTVSRFAPGAGAPELRGHVVHELKREARADSRLDDLVRAFESRHGLR